jgi:hypothetical protein
MAPTVDKRARAYGRVQPVTQAAVNVLAGWLGQQIPPIPKHHNRARAAHRKTPRKRPPKARRSARE